MTAAGPGIGTPPSCFRPVQRSSAVPLYSQIVQQVEEALRRKVISPGSMLPAEPELCSTFQVSRKTLRLATAHLISMGLVQRLPGIGTAIAGEARVDAFGGLRSLHAELAAANRTPKTRVVSLTVVQADAACSRALSYPIGTELYVIKRLRLAHDVPVAILENHLPTSVIQLDVEKLAAGSLDELLRANGRNPHLVEQEIFACAANEEQSLLLGIECGTPIISERLHAFDDQSQLMNVSENYYHPQSYRFHTTAQQ